MDDSCSNKVFFIENYKIDPMEHSIEFLGFSKHFVQPKIIDVLVYLARHYPKLITRQELINNIWDGNKYVGEKALTNAIWSLRKNFSEQSFGKTIIQTIRKTGYRLLIEPKYFQLVKNNNLVNVKLNSGQRCAEFSQFLIGDGRKNTPSKVEIKLIKNAYDRCVENRDAKNKGVKFWGYCALVSLERLLSKYIKNKRSVFVFSTTIFLLIFVILIVIMAYQFGLKSRSQDTRVQLTVVEFVCGPESVSDEKFLLSV